MHKKHHFYQYLKKKIIMAILIAALLPLEAIQPADAATTSVVESRLAQIQKIYSNGSYINDIVKVTYHDSDNSTYMNVDNGGCNALVAYTTLKIFHNPFTPYDTSSYRQVGVAAVSNTVAVYALMKNAKKGDVIAFTSKVQNQNTDYHYGIFEKCSSTGFRLYEANFGPKNKVWDNHYWSYKSIKSRTNGATYVRVYRSKNFNQVNKKTAARNLKKNSTITIRGIRYKVTGSTINNAKLKIISETDETTKIPKYIGFNYDDWDDTNDVVVYYKKPKYITDEQFFTVT